MEQRFTYYQLTLMYCLTILQYINVVVFQWPALTIGLLNSLLQFWATFEAWMTPDGYCGCLLNFSNN